MTIFLCLVSFFVGAYVAGALVTYSFVDDVAVALKWVKILPDTYDLITRKITKLVREEGA